MHAVVIHVNITDLVEAKRALDEDVIPMIKGAPGFLGAYFVAMDDTHGVSIAAFETEEQARATVPPEGAQTRGVTIESLHIGQVIGAA